MPMSLLDLLVSSSGSDPMEERSLHQIHELQLSLDAEQGGTGGTGFIVTRI